MISLVSAGFLVGCVVASVITGVVAVVVGSDVAVLVLQPQFGSVEKGIKENDRGRDVETTLIETLE